MTTYKEIQGISVETKASDPPGPFLGQVWYNSTSDSFKIYTSGILASWASGGNIGTSRKQHTAAGTQTAGLIAGGSTKSGLFGAEVFSASTEEYNGTSWTSGGNLGTARFQFAGCGTQTAGVVFSGENVEPPMPAPSQSVRLLTEEYNGTSWSSGGTMSTKRKLLGGAGTQTAALAIGGNSHASGGASSRDVTEEYNGTSWTSGGNLNNAKYGVVGAGTQTAGLAFGGHTPSPSVNIATEEYDGTSWTSGNNMTQAFTFIGGGGIQTAGLAFGNTDPFSEPNGKTLLYDGSSWSSSADMTDQRTSFAGNGPQAGGFAAGGNGGSDDIFGIDNLTEEFTAGPVVGTETLTEE